MNPSEEEGKPPASAGAQAGMFFLGLIAGVALQFVYSLVAALSLESGSAKTNVVIYVALLSLPLVVLAIAAVMAIRRKKTLLGMFLVGTGIGTLGPLFTCAGIALSSNA